MDVPASSRVSCLQLVTLYTRSIIQISLKLYVHVVASFPGPAQLSVASVLQATKSWAGPGNEAMHVARMQSEVFVAGTCRRYLRHCLVYSFFGGPLLAVVLESSVETLTLFWLKRAAADR